MPMTEFALMRRSDHSMRPPTPAATIAFKSPNACNLCHTDKDAQWADTAVRTWHERDYQAPVLRRARLIDAARKQDWKQLPDMLAYLAAKDHDAVYAASLIRLLQGSDDDRIWPAFRASLKDPSPLVRAAAANALAMNPSPETRDALLAAAADEHRLVRVEAAYALSGYPRDHFSPAQAKQLARATAEYVGTLTCRPDDGISHYNLGNFHLNRGELEKALASFKISMQLRPQYVPAVVNASLIYARLGDGTNAERSLRRALQLDPANAVANFNLGLLLAEQGNLGGAEESLRAALKADPRFHEAAYNLGVLLARDGRDEGIRWCRRAIELRPGEPKYGYTLAFFLNERGSADEACQVLRRTIASRPSHPDAYSLLGAIYEREGRLEDAETLYRQATAERRLPPAERQRFAERLRLLEARGGR
jgi:tetratricopeptide (TPR) repeat protein